MKTYLFLFLLICYIYKRGVSSEEPGEVENPSDIASVSKFITDFHRQFEDESLALKRSEPVGQEISRSENISHRKTNGKPIDEVSEAPDKNATFLIKCTEDRKHGGLTVELVNSTRLVTLLTPNPNVTNRLMPAECLVLLFYARTCPFSCLAAPHFNALPRAFPSIRMTAFNAMQFQSFNTQFGIAGVPTVMLFHNGRPAAKFNDTDYTLEMFSRFITRYTGVKPAEKMFVTSGDFGGPIPSVLAKETDYLLGLAWAVIIIAAAVGVSKSTGWRTLVETIQVTWREAQAQHEHEHNE